MSEYIIRETTYPLATGQEVVGELVRCKECVFFENENPCGIVDWWNDPDDFCSKGRRRE